MAGREEREREEAFCVAPNTHQLEDSHQLELLSG